MDAEQGTRTELFARLELMEAMVQEGRRSTEYWGWSFVLWGAAYLMAIGWGHWSHRPDISWPVTMVAATVITIVIGSKKRKQPRTTISRSIGGVWIAVGSALFLYCFSAEISGHAEPHAYMAAIETLLGVANCASALVLRWRPQFLVALVWWVSAVVTCFVSVTLVVSVLVVATLIGNISFGLYLMYRERRDRQNTVQHG
jgi:hypothetical protein